MMRFILDTHALLWWLSGDSQLGSDARAKIEDRSNEVIISSASLWEITIKQSLGRLEVDIAKINSEIIAQGFKQIGIEIDHLVELVTLPHHHRDPFDRMLIAQARSERVPLMTNDGAMGDYAVQVIPTRS